MEVHGVDIKQGPDFPYSGLRVLGGVQTGIGCACVFLGVLDLALTLTSRAVDSQIYTAASGQLTAYELSVTLVVASSPIWCGTWFIICGSIGTCVSRVRAHSLLFFRNTFLTLSMLCALLFGPACLGISGYGAFVTVVFQRHSLSSSDYDWLLPMMVTFLALFEVILTVTSAAICCCCSPVQLTKVHVLFAEPHSRQFPEEVMQIKTNVPDIWESTYKPPRPPPSEPPPSRGLRARPEKEASDELPTLEVRKLDSHSRNSYWKLKKWAVPDD